MALWTVCLFSLVPLARAAGTQLNLNPSAQVSKITNSGDRIFEFSIAGPQPKDRPFLRGVRFRVDQENRILGYEMLWSDIPTNSAQTPIYSRKVDKKFEKYLEASGLGKLDDSSNLKQPHNRSETKYRVVPLEDAIDKIKGLGDARPGDQAAEETKTRLRLQWKDYFFGSRADKAFMSETNENPQEDKNATSSLFSGGDSRVSFNQEVLKDLEARARATGIAISAYGSDQNVSASALEIKVPGVDIARIPQDFVWPDNVGKISSAWQPGRRAQSELTANDNGTRTRPLR